MVQRRNLKGTTRKGASSVFRLPIEKSGSVVKGPKSKRDFGRERKYQSDRKNIDSPKRRKGEKKKGGVGGWRRGKREKKEQPGRVVFDRSHALITVIDQRAKLYSRR